jgi:hypothetical protein
MTLEMGTGILAASLATLRPLFNALLRVTGRLTSPGVSNMAAEGEKGRVIRRYRRRRGEFDLDLSLEEGDCSYSNAQTLQRETIASLKDEASKRGVVD